ncbi:DinB family protein [Arenibacter sp. M-2]|uniref:DinB family protein n=1 Tax=unclassified Arenibacter TaxID=2615047 RepID=UPI000D770E89|nr:MULTISPECIES: DinB family protein [unclassified Arenibacter]MDL5513403.1 DinB family protein [Arenibacter sp. M-2]PXX27731.1 putative damage-inducible protein DinB [Arenibacter sp. ARW7G5Y1]
MKDLLFVLIILFVVPLQSQDLVIPTFLEKWENSKTYLVDIAEAMPAEKYNFKPTERQKVFKDQLLHIKGNMDWLCSTYFGGQKLDNKTDINSTPTKEEIIKSLIDSFDRVGTILKNTPSSTLSEKVEFFAGKKSRLQILNLLQDHVTHHRGQLIVYLNLNNIEPPKYVGW